MPACLPTPDPSLVAQHKACAINIEHLDPEYAALKARVEKGSAYCIANVVGPQCKEWLRDVLSQDAYDVAAGQTARALLERLKREQPGIREAVVVLLNLRREIVKIEQRLETETLMQSDIETSMLLAAGLTGLAYFCRGCGAFVPCEEYAGHEEQCCPRGG